MTMVILWPGKLMTQASTSDGCEPGEKGWAAWAGKGCLLGAGIDLSAKIKLHTMTTVSLGSQVFSPPMLMQIQKPHEVRFKKQ